ncbi:hypothetical protein MAUB1S_07917 [Mycolicibacterium aubagnense]
MKTIEHTPNVVLVLGSAPDALEVREWDRSAIASIVAINNAWVIRDDWDYLIYPDDFPSERLPATQSTSALRITSDEFVPAQNEFGGFVYAGGTMAFTAAYWALHALKPDVLVFLGCDMIYSEVGRTHFYGNGTADPLRQDVTLRSLEAKSSRLFVTALRAGTICLNLSNFPRSRLTLPRTTLATLSRLTTRRIRALYEIFSGLVVREAEAAAKSLEANLGYFVEDGRYWKKITEFSESCIDRIDASWTDAIVRIPRSCNSRDVCQCRNT